MLEVTTKSDPVKIERVLEEYTACVWGHLSLSEFYFELDDAVKIWNDIKPLRDFISDLGKAIGRE